MRRLSWKKPNSYDSLINGESARIKHVKSLDGSKPVVIDLEGQIKIDKKLGGKGGIIFKSGKIVIEISSLSQIEVLRGEG